MRQREAPEAGVLEVGELLEGGRAVHAEGGNDLQFKSCMKILSNCFSLYDLFLLVLISISATKFLL